MPLPKLLDEGADPRELRASDTSLRKDVVKIDQSDKKENVSASRRTTYAQKGVMTVILFFVLIIVSTQNSYFSNLFYDHLSPTKSRNLDCTVSHLLSKTPLIDGHNDLAYLIRKLYSNKIYNKNFTDPFEKGETPYHVDLARLRAGKAGGAFWSAFIPCPAQPLNFSDGNYADAISQTLTQIDLIHRLTSSYPSTFSAPTLSSQAAHHAFRHHPTHPLISPIGIEGLHQAGNSISLLRLYHSLGAKYTTLTHNCPNIYADSALLQPSPGSPAIVAPPVHNGLSEQGVRAVREMNRMGMLVDLAHVSHDTMLDVLGGRPEKFEGGSKAPVMFSHSSAYSLCPHPRNVPDDVLALVKKTDSIVMVNFAPDFISCVAADARSESANGLPEFYPPNSTLHQVARHVVYIGQLIGYDHVGLGSDFDGIPTTPQGLEDVSKFPDLVKELLRMGVSKLDVRKIVGENVLRVWKAAEKVGEELRGQGVMPMEDELSDLSHLVKR